MMKITLFALGVLALACAFPQAQQEYSQQQPQASASGQAPVQIVRQDSDVDLNGYHFEFETSDGTSRQEQGEYKNDTSQEGLVVKGSYRYVAPDGQHISVSFQADKNGYQPIEHNGEQNNSQTPSSAQNQGF